MRLRSRALLVLLPLAFGSSSVLSAVAQEDTMRQEWESLKDQAGFGADRAPIDFTERPPLAVPPSYTLPPPGSGPTMPVDDPDVMARRKALSDSRRPVPPTDPGAAASGRSSRTYLIDPPSGMRDPDIVASGIQTDTGVGPDSKATHHRHRRTAAPQ